MFISGEDMVKEMQEQRQKEIDDFNNKVVVKNKHFKVNTRVVENHAMTKARSMLEDKASKVGLRFGKEKLAKLTARQILATREMTQAPQSQFSMEPYIMNEGVVKPMKVKFNLN